MVLNRVRKSIEPLMNSLGRALGSTGISPNAWTFLGFVLSVIAGFFFATRPSQPYIAAIFIVLSGVVDMFDGAVARSTNRVTRAGSFNDSTLDRVAEVAIYAGIVYGSYTSSLIVLLALSFSLLVSYARAKGDSLNVTLSGVGVGERAERLLALVVFALVGYVWIGVYVVLILALVTFIQRYLHILRNLSVGTPK